MTSIRVVPATEFFEAIARRYDAVYAMPTDVSRRRMTGILTELPPHANVLDLGVGTGRELTALLDGGHTVIGLDSSESMLERCSRRARPVPLVLADFWEPLPFADAAFDAVLALHGTLSHPPDSGALVRLGQEIRRVLVPGGLLVAEVPSPPWLALVERGDATGEGMRAVRTGDDQYRHEDLASGLAICATVLSEQRWRDALDGLFTVSIRALTEVEQLVVARATLPR